MSNYIKFKYYKYILIYIVIIYNLFTAFNLLQNYSLYYAADRGSIQDAVKAISSGANPNFKLYFKNESAIIPAIRNNDKKMINLLVIHGANLNNTLADDDNCLNIAAKYSNIETFITLITDGAKIQNIKSVFLDAVISNNVNITRYLLEKGANVNMRFNMGITPLHCSTSIEISTLLLKMGANINAKRDDGRTPIDEAIESGNIDMIQFLIKNKSDLTIADNNGITPLRLASMTSNTRASSIINLLINNGAR